MTKLLCKWLSGITASSRVAMNVLRNTGPAYLRAGDKGALASATMEHCVAMATASDVSLTSRTLTHTLSLSHTLHLLFVFICQNLITLLDCKRRGTV